MNKEKRKQLKFFLENSKEYATNLKGAPDSDEHFKFLCDKMLKHEDYEIRIELPRYLMRLGFNKLVGDLTQGMLQMMKDGLFKEG